MAIGHLISLVSFPCPSLVAICFAGVEILRFCLYTWSHLIMWLDDHVTSSVVVYPSHKSPTFQIWWPYVLKNWRYYVFNLSRDLAWSELGWLHVSASHTKSRFCMCYINFRWKYIIDLYWPVLTCADLCWPATCTSNQLPDYFWNHTQYFKTIFEGTTINIRATHNNKVYSKVEKGY